MDNNKLEYSQNGWDFYSNSDTKRITNMYGYKCLLAIGKKTSEYIIYDERGIPFYSNESYEALGCHLDILNLLSIEEVED